LKFKGEEDMARNPFEFERFYDELKKAEEDRKVTEMFRMAMRVVEDEKRNGNERLKKASNYLVSEHGVIIMHPEESADDENENIKEKQKAAVALPSAEARGKKDFLFGVLPLPPLWPPQMQLSPETVAKHEDADAKWTDMIINVPKDKKKASASSSEDTDAKYAAIIPKVFCLKRL
jgi:hypothetical protein